MALVEVIITKETAIEVPNTLGGSPEAAETFLRLVSGAQPGGCVTLSLAAVTWICPYGAVILLGACRYLAQLSGQAVRLVALRPDVHAYLRRIDFFEHSNGTAYTLDTFDEANQLSRRAASSNVLELVPITNKLDVYEVGNRARKILSYWLTDDSHNTDRIVSLLAEACSNVVDHSCDVGVVSIQKYVHNCYVDVELAISDLGIGIRRSLSDVHGDVSDTASGYIERALAGLSARRSGRGGQGLGAIQRIATRSGGAVFIRSETGQVTVQATETSRHDGLVFFPGTQVAVTFRSRASLQEIEALEFASRQQA